MLCLRYGIAVSMIRKPEFETRANSFQSLRLQCGSRSAATCKRIQMKRKKHYFVARAWACNSLVLSVL